MAWVQAERLAWKWNIDYRVKKGADAGDRWSQIFFSLVFNSRKTWRNVHICYSNTSALTGHTLHTGRKSARSDIQQLLCLHLQHQLLTTSFIYLTESQIPECDDGVFAYATEFPTLTMVWHTFQNAIREGDGKRILWSLKFLYLIFKASNRRNYANEALQLLLQYHCTLPERKQAQLLWSRCINKIVYQGANTLCDLHMEHLNRRLKSVIRVMGANVKPATIEKGGKSIAVIHRVCQAFEELTTRCSHSDHHPVLRSEKTLILYWKHWMTVMCSGWYLAESIKHLLFEKV